MKDTYLTERLVIKPISKDDYTFIKTLVNTPSWLRFIGDKNIKTEEAAKNYIRNLIANPDITYWTIRLQNEEQTPIGVVTLIKRDYLEYHDIGYALLETYTKKGFATEAVSYLLQNIIDHNDHAKLCAITLKENIASINLLQKLGFSFEKEIENNLTLVYVAIVDELGKPQSIQ